MCVSNYHPFDITLRVNGWLFDKVWLAVHAFDRVVRYGVLIEDPEFGKFELSSNMILEWRLSGRWYQTKPELLIDHILSKGDPYEAARRDRNHGG